MSELPAGSLTYETVVTEYFLALRGTGLMLSPLDSDQICEWERRGLPIAVVCRGLRRGVEQARGRPDRPDVSIPRSLRAYRLSVEDEWRAYRSGRVGEAGSRPDESAAAALRLQAARALIDSAISAARGPRRDAYTRAAGSLAQLREPPMLLELEAALDRADECIVRAWLGELSLPERTALGARCRLRTGPRLPTTRPASHRDALRAHLFDAAREAGLLRLRGSV